jgi:hypothetical protein
MRQQDPRREHSWVRQYADQFECRARLYAVPPGLCISNALRSHISGAWWADSVGVTIPS